MMKPLTIYTSKKKSFGNFLGAVLFVFLGVMMLISDPSPKYPKWFLIIVGSFSIVFFSFAGGIILLRLISTKRELILNNEGINFQGKTFVAWEDIRGFQPIKIVQTKIILINVKDPQRFINQEKRFLYRKLMQFNTKYYGTPFCTSSVGLAISSEQLLAMLRKYKKEVTALKKAE